MEKLAPIKFFTDSHYNYSNYQHKSKQQGINTPQWETQAIDFFDLKYYKFNLNVTIDHSHVPAVLPLLSLTDFSSKCSLSPFSQSPAPCLPPPPPFIVSILALITTTVLMPARVSRIFSLTLSVSPPPLS